MAIALPYPSLVFVPLDKLTAEEMNQIVANYTAIANNAAKASFFTADNTDYREFNSSGPVSIQPLDVSTIPVGAKFMAMGQAMLQSTYSPSTRYMTCIMYNSQYNLSDSWDSGPDRPSHTATLMDVFEKIAGVDTVELALDTFSIDVNVVRTQIFAWIVD